MESAFTRSLGQRLNSSVILAASSIEDDFFDTFVEGSFGDRFSDFLGTIAIAAIGARSTERLLDRACRNEGDTLGIVDDLHVNMFIAAKNRQSRSAVRRPPDLISYAEISTFPAFGEFLTCSHCRLKLVRKIGWDRRSSAGIQPSRLSYLAPKALPALRRTYSP